MAVYQITEETIKEIEKGGSVILNPVPFKQKDGYTPQYIPPDKRKFLFDELASVGTENKK